jgi:hypothetical protein
MTHVDISEKDRQQITSHGLTEEAVLDQIAKFRKGTPYLRLDRVCGPGDGIQVLDEDLFRQCLEAYRSLAPVRRMAKFVPASGAATRMFKTLTKANNKFDRIGADDLESGLLDSEEENRELSEFVEGLARFAFFPELAAKMDEAGQNPMNLMEDGEYKPLIDYLLTDKGLSYSQKPKGLLSFHSYEKTVRTAFEEHLVEAAGYSRMENGGCRLHFTVSPEHQADFEALFEKRADPYAEELDARFTADFSLQAPHTDTIAVDMDNQPFRKKDGSLLFRPGGHGALLENLNRMESEIIFIKNIDNVVHDRLKTDTIRWKQLLCGYLLLIQEQIFRYVRVLEENRPLEPVLEEITDFVETSLCIRPPESFYTGDTENRRRYLLDRLNRPLRVCGMVPNVGEPGGGPFWVADNKGQLSIQIVETSQIDPDDEYQQAIQQGLTHFNPVDLVCAPYDRHGKPFDLSWYTDPEAVFIAYKSEEGRDLKALEHPGLWNGGMARWNSVFIEVPLITFNPVKRVNDLLRGPHQPSDE